MNEKKMSRVLLKKMAAYELIREGTIGGVGELAYVEAPFNESIALFKQEGFKLISARDLAYARIQTGENSSISRNGSWIKEGILYFPKQKDKIVLVRSSAVLRSPAKATEAHRQGKEFFLTEKGDHEYLERVRAQKDSIHVLKSTESIPTNRFGEDETTAWLFGDQAQEYGRFLEEKAGINAMPLYFNSSIHIKSQRKPYANQLWLSWFRFSGGSNLDGNWGLSDIGRARGVKQTAEGCRVEQKVVEAYTSKQISNALKGLNLSGLENQILRVLNKGDKK